MKLHILIAALTALNALVIEARGDQCSKSQYERCTSMADPLIHDPHLIFPDNMEDIDKVCLTWNNFVDCLKNYIERCFTPSERNEFNKAVENPIRSVHLMCTQPEYQAEYLRYAPCLKNLITKGTFCGNYYNVFVSQVQEPDLQTETLCCSYNRFKYCVLTRTKDVCESGRSGVSATNFANEITDKAFSFVQNQCATFRPNSGECGGTPVKPSASTAREARPLTTSQARQNTFHDSAMQAETSQQTHIPKPSSTWLPSALPSLPDTPYSNMPTQSPVMTGTEVKTRPASYGRASSWTDTQVTQSSPSSIWSGTNTEAAQYSPTSGATVSSWAVVQASPEVRHGDVPDAYTASSTTWYPAAGSQLTNEVDEPNQLGLVKNEQNNAGNGPTLSFIFIIVALLHF